MEREREGGKDLENVEKMLGNFAKKYLKLL